MRLIRVAVAAVGVLVHEFLLALAVRHVSFMSLSFNGVVLACLVHEHVHDGELSERGECVLSELPLQP